MTYTLRVARLAPLLLCPLLPRLALAQPAKFTQDAITLRQDPSLATDAVRKGYVDALVATVSAAVAAAQATAGGAVPQSQLGQPNGPARLGPDGTLPAAQLPVGTAAGTVAAGNDPRILGAVQAGTLAPVAKSGSYADLVGTPAIPAPPVAGTTAGTFAPGNDSRITGAVQAGTLAPVAVSGSYADLTGKPAIPPAPTAGTMAGTFAAGNDPRIAGALQTGSVAPVAVSGSYADLTGKPAIPPAPTAGTTAGTFAAGDDPRIAKALQPGSLAPVATSGSYADLTGKPTIPSAPTAGTTAGTFAAGNDSRITGAVQTGTLSPVATSGSYADLAGKPAIPTVPAFGTGAGTVAQGNDARIVGAIQAGSLAPVATSGSYADLSSKPVIPPAPVAGTGPGTFAAGNDTRITGAAQASALAPVATSGAYGSLSGLPVIPVVPAFGTGAGTVAQGNDARIVGAAQANTLAPVATSGAYGSLSGLPVIPVVPAFGTGAGTVAQGNDARIVGAAQASTLAPVATSGAYASLSGLPVIPVVPAFGATSGTVAQGNDVRIPVVGNQTGGTGSMVVDLLHENGTFVLKNEAGIWGSANVRAYLGVSRTFNAGEGAANGPVAALFGFANNNGSAADVVAVLGSAVARTSNTGSVFGANFIARTASGVNAKLVGLEVDVEPAAGTTASAGSGGVFINAYSSAVPGPAILMGGLSGGTFANGVQCAAVASTGSCLAPQVGSTPGTMMNSTVATLADAAIRIGPISAGAGQRIVLQGSDALDAVITTDTNKFLKIATGTNGVVFTNQPQTANLLLLSGSNGDLTLPINGGKLNGTGDLILNATTGQVNLLTGVKLAIRTVTAGASDTALASDATIKWVKATGSASAQGIPACVSAIRGRVLAVKDGKGDAATNPITVAPAAGTIDGAASTIVNTARGAVTLQCDGSGDWSVLARL